MSDPAHGYVDINDLVTSKPVRVLRALTHFDLADWDDLTASVGIADNEHERAVYHAVMRRLIVSGRVNRISVRGSAWFQLTDKGRADLVNVSRRIAASVMQVAS